MDFSFGPDIADLNEGARTFLEGANGVERLRQDGDDPLALWSQLAELGLVGVTAPEEAGGIGLGFTDAIQLCQSFGFSALPEPVGETIAVIIPMLVRCGELDKVRRIINGEIRISVSHTLNPCVNFFENSDELMVITAERVSLHNPSDTEADSIEGVDPWRHLSQVQATGGGLSVLAEGEDAQTLCAESANRGAVEAAAEMCGLAERMILLATEYAKERQQFGQAIGRFQAVKHMLATAQVKLEFARPVVYRAAADIDSSRAPLLVAHAKVAATDAAILAGETAIQVFGGMGYTYEADLHYFMKRAWALAGNWGSREQHLGVIEKAISDSEFEIGPAATFA